MTEPKWIVFEDLGWSSGGRTRRWAVLSKDGRVPLGHIAWFGRWFKYAFFTSSTDVVLEAGEEIVLHRFIEPGFEPNELQLCRKAFRKEPFCEISKPAHTESFQRKAPSPAGASDTAIRRDRGISEDPARVRPEGRRAAQGGQRPRQAVPVLE